MLKIEWGVASGMIEGESVSGDAHFIQTKSDTALMAAIDGAGHGVEAAAAAERVVSVLKESSGESLVELLQRCHRALTGARGAAISLAVFDARRSDLTWCGVGNVEGVLLHENGENKPEREVLLLRNGVVGYTFTVPRVSTLPVRVGDCLVFATDGIYSDFSRDIALDGSCQRIADAILSRHSKGTDDALALVVRFGIPAA